jgi:tripartite-type tricarboxylate transporter receptor subunit TctC
LPDPLITRLHDEIARILGTDAVKEKLASLGFSASPSTPTELAAAVKTGLEVRGQLMKSAGIQPE